MIGLRYATIDFHAPDEDGNVVTTRFHTGETVGARHHPGDPHYHVIAHRCGYNDTAGGSGLIRYCQEHEFFHEFLSEALFNRPSYVLWTLATGRNPDPGKAAQEEMAVMTFQRWVRANEEPIVGGFDWWALREAAIAQLRVR